MDGLVLAPLAFAAGLVAFASPCFLPIVPVFLSFITERNATSRYPALAATAGKQGFILGSNTTATRTSPSSRVSQGTKGAFFGAVAFSAAFSLVFCAFWLLIAAVGFAVSAWREPLQIVAGCVLVVMGLHTIGLLRIPLLDRAFKPIDKTGTPGTIRGCAVLGFTFGLGWSPCIGPILGAVIGLATQTESVVSGAILLVVYCLGMSLPLIAIAMGLQAAQPLVVWLTAHRRAISRFTGLLLIVVGLLMITGLFEKVASLWLVA